MLKLSSNKQKIVIAADPHNDYKKLDNIFKREDGDINICLGDWFDSFSLDDPSDYVATAKYLTEVFLPNPKNYTLFGNHDIHYLFKAPTTWCSGYEQWKYNAIDSVLGSDRNSITEKFYWSIVVDDILLTHAGLDCRMLPSNCDTHDKIFNYLDRGDEEARIKLKTDDLHWFYQVGHSRGGNARAGGIVWCDFKYEFQPIEDLRQIVGHTNQWETGKAAQYHREGFTNIVEANNICIDCNLNQYITIFNGKIELKDYINL